MSPLFGASVATSDSETVMGKPVRRGLVLTRMVGLRSATSRMRGLSQRLPRRRIEP